MDGSAGIDEGLLAGDVELVAEVHRLGSGSERASLPRHRHRMPREQVERQQRARIIVAVAEVVTERGYDAAAVREITARAGVSSRTFYSLYDDKEDAFFDAYTLLDGVVVGGVAERLSRADPRQIAAGTAVAFLETLSRWPLFTRMHTVEARGAGPRVLERRTQVFRAFVRALGEALTRAGAGDGRISVPSDAVLMAVVGGIGELVLQHVVEAGPESLPELAPSVIELIDRVAYPPPDPEPIGG